MFMLYIDVRVHIHPPCHMILSFSLQSSYLLNMAKTCELHEVQAVTLDGTRSLEEGLVLTGLALRHHEQLEREAALL